MIETLEPACAPDDGRVGGASATLVPAVVRALALLERVARQRQPMSASQLATELALPRSSVHGLCHTLLHHGYLRRQGDGGFAIGLERWVGRVVEAANIREVTLFPRDLNRLAP